MMKKWLYSPMSLREGVLWGVGVLVTSLLVASMSFGAVTGYRALSTLNYPAGDSTSTYPPDSCVAYYIGKPDGSNADSAYRLATRYWEPRGWAGEDVLAAWTMITPGQINTNQYNPIVWFNWYLPDGRVIRDNAPQVVHVVRMADSLQESD